MYYIIVYELTNSHWTTEMAQLAIVPAKSAMHPIKASPQLSSPFGTGAGKQNYLDFFISNFHLKQNQKRVTQTRKWGQKEQKIVHIKVRVPK